MNNQIFSIANCRVSTAEQLKNGSLDRQATSVELASKKLEAPIVRVWSGNVSSKAGNNVKRKDLLEMLEYCKKNKKVKYAIFDEYDRFMRSVNEGPYFEVCFQLVGVKVWYASESDSFNGDDANAKFMRTMSGYKAEGSNEERQRKSISGNRTELLEGKYPFHPKAGYKKGTLEGIHEIHPIRGLALQKSLIAIATYELTPTQALILLNNSPYTKSRKSLKMDKFRNMITDPYYAGILTMDKQIKVDNVTGLHEPLITISQHLELVKIMENKKKCQSGPRKNGNPKYPLSNLVSCGACIDNPIGRVVGYDHGNGKNPNLVYEKYRCRGCGSYMTRQELHKQITGQFSNKISNDVLGAFLVALEKVWRNKESQATADIRRIRGNIEAIKESIRKQVEAATDPENVSIKQEILESIKQKKAEIETLEMTVEELESLNDSDKIRFLKFAFNFIENMGSSFLEISTENRLRCKQIIFPGGFVLDSNKIVYTPKVSPIYRVVANKKDLSESEKSLLVRVKGL